MKLEPQTVLENTGRRFMRPVQQLIQTSRLWRQVWDEAKDVAAEYGLSPWRLLREQAMLYAFHSISPQAYFQYRLFDPEISWDEKKTYLPTRIRGNRLWALLTPKKYGALFDNKLIFKRLFSSLGFPLAELYGVYDPVFGYTAAGRPLKNAADLDDWIRTSGVEAFVFKPVEGLRGRKILVFSGRRSDDPGKLITLGGEEYDAAQLAAFAKDTAKMKASSPEANASSFLIEERIRQHPGLAGLVGQTLCTVRVQTIIALDGKPKIIAAVFKLQPNPTGVDHMLHGGVGCWVDLETGALGRGRTHHDFDYTSLVPGTDISFVGFRLPCWDEVKDVALRAAMAFPWARAIGWDIAIAEGGPMLIEGNARWGTTLIQTSAPHGLMTGEFKALCEAALSGKER